MEPESDHLGLFRDDPPFGVNSENTDSGNPRRRLDRQRRHRNRRNMESRFDLEKEGDRLIFDFTGSDKQARRGINLPYHATFGACFEAVLSTFGYDLPRNHGALVPSR